MLRYVLVLLSFGLFVSVSATYTVCVLPHTPSYYSAAQICEKLGPTQVRCVVAVDRLDCMKMINSGEADFAVFEAEDLLITAEDKHLSDILVTHRIHATENKKWEYGVVALVSNKANISKLTDLKGKRLCHPGNDPFSANYDWSEVFSLYFENRVAPQVCEKDISVEENRIKSLADFFGLSCKPGVWSADPEDDAQLKKKYGRMCGLCDVPSVCSQRDKYWGRQGALYCLSDCLGDVAWSMLKDAKLHFSNVGVSVCSDVSLLCPDGSTRPLNSSDPCVWVTRPVPVIAAKRAKAEEIQVMLKEVLQMPDTTEDLVRLLESSPRTPPVQLKPSQPPRDYLAAAPGFLSANSMSVCGQDSRAVSLCVSALQDKIKCEWLAAVSKVFGVQPSLSCLYGANCLISVANRSADVTIANTDKLLPAVRDHGLKPLLVQLPLQLKKAKTVSAVVKSSSKLKNFSDLKGKKACFPSIDGIGWTSFTITMQKSNSFSGTCPYTKAMSKFFSEICVSEPSSAAAGFPNIKVCSGEYQSEKLDRAEPQEAAYDNEALAFQCLAVGGGDVAFISSDFIPKYLEDLKGNPEYDALTVDNFQPLCESSSTSTDCLLSWSSYSQVLVHDKLSRFREEDVRSLFTSINSLFGHPNTPSTRTFNMFNPANSLFDTLYSGDPTVTKQRLEQIEDFLEKAKQRPKNYEMAVHTHEKCAPSSASQPFNSFSHILTVLPFLYITLIFSC